MFVAKMSFIDDGVGRSERVGAGSSAKMGSFKMLTKQSSTVESDDRHHMLKHESKESGIVTEMSVKPKDKSGRSQKEYTRSQTVSSTASSKTKRIVKSKNQSDKIKRSQSVKVKGNLKEQHPDTSSQISHDDLEIDLLAQTQNGLTDDEQEKGNPSTIRGIWKKACKTLKNSSSIEKLSRKSGSFHKNKQNSKDVDDEVEFVNGGSVDPVYSLLKCAADLPRVGRKSPCFVHQHCIGLHSPGDDCTPKASSPSSSGSTSPHTPESLGSDFKKIYKLTSPGKKTSSAFDTIFSS